eukprot:3854655-Pleurochrysis_carterae.AAC.2
MIEGITPHVSSTARCHLLLVWRYSSSAEQSQRAKGDEEHGREELQTHTNHHSLPLVHSRELLASLLHHAHTAGPASSQRQRRMGMEGRPRVAIMPQGSRGDCQPFIGLAITLCKQGAVVKVFASKTHLSLAKPFLVDADGAESKGQGSLDFVSSENFDYDALYKHPLMVKSLQTGDLRLFQKAFEDQASSLIAMTT